MSVPLGSCTADSVTIHRKVQQPLPGPSFVLSPGSGTAALSPRPGGLNLARLWGKETPTGPPTPSALPRHQQRRPPGTSPGYRSNNLTSIFLPLPLKVFHTEYPPPPGSPSFTMFGHR
ncbi:Hypothetical predicted protein [Marmota monax]|uniref:Uncharacterized protein n=1 Tax=Marmota monax TaxID=9995 RepID=A0A5E4AH79_MARMO|nr:hypothetical protein GHT09_000825 [Marmota monax]VTJ56076.1 Hypothetical predicted protein [Marmota monax]